jgi:hypothetical protein
MDFNKNKEGRFSYKGLSTPCFEIIKFKGNILFVHTIR